MRGCQVGAGQTSSGFTEGGEIFQHGENARAAGLVDEVREAKTRDAADLLQGDQTFLGGIMRDALGEGCQHRVRRVTFYRHDERHAEALAVLPVECREALELLRRECGEPRAFLLAGRCLGQLAALRRASGEFGMRANQRHLQFLGRVHDRIGHRGVQRQAAGEGPQRGDAFGHPR